MTIGRDITAANSVLMLSISGLFDSPQQLQGFSADDVFDTEATDAAETMMGVDGKLSAGYVPVPVNWSITLMADSDSNILFEQWYEAEKTARTKYWANATVLLPAIGRKWTMTNGVLMSLPQIPVAKKVLQPRKFGIRWESISPAAS